jgi:hypothetical protein
VPTSLPKRVEALEQRAPRRRPSRHSERLLEELEALALAGSVDLGDDFWQAWGRYAAVRERLGAAREMPPADYRAGDRPPVRNRMWRAWDHPEAGRALVSVLAAVVRSHERP